MAFQSGSQVNAALGRTDFTPFLQGAMQGAQAQGRAGELIGQGLAGLGQQVATGVEKYYKKQEEKQLNEQATETVSRILQTNPAFGAQVGLKPDASGNIDRKAIGAVVKSLGGAANTIQFANTLNEFTRKQAEDTQAAQYASAVTNAGGRPFSMVNQVSPTAQFRGAEMAAGLAKTKSETAENLVNRIKPVATVYPTADAARIAGEAANPGLVVQVENAPGGFQFKAAQRMVPDDETKIRLESFGQEVDRIIQTGEAARQVAPAINSLLGLIDSGNLKTGFGEAAKAQFRSVGKAIGFPVDEAALANAQQANAMFGQMILQYYQQTKGSISNAENILFQSFGPELGKSEAANKAILTFSKKRNEFDRDLERIAKDYRLGKLDRQKAQEQIISRQDKYDNDIGSLIPNAPAATGNPAPNQAAINYLKQNPNARAAFDEKYGAGAAKQVLGN
jgi:hypothetical protein